MNLVTINADPEFPGQVSAELRRMLEQRYLRSAHVGFFKVRWKE